MKKFKEKIKEFKEKTKKEKVRDILYFIIYFTLIAIAITMAIGLFIKGENKEKTAGAYYEKEEKATNWNDYQNTLFGLTIGKTAYSMLEAGVSIDFESNTFVLVHEINGKVWSQNVTKARATTTNTELRLYVDGTTDRYIRIIFNIIASGTRPYGYTLKRVIGTGGDEGGIFKIVYIKGGTAEQNKIRKLMWDWSTNKAVDDLINGLGITPDQLEEQYNQGYNSGYNTGFNNGYVDGQGSVKTEFSPISMIIDPIAKFMSTPLFGEFGIGHFFMVAMAVSIAIIFLKIFAGG